MASAHTSKVYEHELRTLREKLLHMGSLVEEMIRASIRALEAQDAELARRTLLVDRRINRLECEVDELCMRILATRQPVASDLRFVTIALKVVTDLERMGDLCVNICERVIELAGEEDALPGPALGDVVRLADEAKGVVREALDAFVVRDVTRASELLGRDHVIDEHYARIFRDLLTQMSEHPSSVYRATRIQSIAKYLERIADHAMNVAETVIFLVQGRDVRHRGKRMDSDAPTPPSSGKRG